MRKRLRDENSITIVRSPDNTTLDTIVYEFENLDGNKVSLAVNNIKENLFSQVDE